MTGAAVDRRADIYGMGCVLYVATLGVRPFGTGGSALPKIVHGRYHLPSKIASDYPKGLEAIVVRALAKDRRDRYQTADELRLALERWMVESGSVATSSDVARCMQARMQPKRRELVRAVMTSATKLPEALAYELLASQDRTATPTATSKLLAQERAASESMLEPESRSGDEDPTRIDRARASNLHLAHSAYDADDPESIDPTWVSARRRRFSADETRTSIRAGRALRRQRARGIVLWFIVLLLLLAIGYLAFS